MQTENIIWMSDRKKEMDRARFKLKIENETEEERAARLQKKRIYQQSPAWKEAKKKENAK